jgi:hypothetical protein
MKSYEVVVTREGRWWMIGIPELDGLTQARRLDEVEKMAREYIAVTLDVPLSQVEVSISAVEVAGEDVLETMVLVDELRKHARQLEELVADLARGFASALADAKVPVRDVSKLLGVSHQRVSQLVQAGTKIRPSDLAQIMLTAKAEHRNDLVVHLKAGEPPLIVEAETPKPATKSSHPRTTAAREVSRTARRKSAKSGPAGVGVDRPTTAGRAIRKK